MSGASAVSSAVRRLSAGRGDAAQRNADAQTLADAPPGDRRVTRALVLGLWDDDRDVRRLCKRTLRRRFREMRADDRRLLLEVLFVNLAGASDPPRQAVSFLSAVVGWVRNHRSSEPHLFSAIVAEAERSRRGGSYPPRVRNALKDLYRSAPTDDSPTADVVTNFNQQRSLNQLLSETAPPEEVKSSLRLLGDGSLSETDFDVLLYHLVPLRNSKDQSVMMTALRNLKAWSAELPGDDEFALTEAVEALDAYQRADREQLPGRLRNEIALSEVAVEALGREVDRLRDLPQYRQSIEHVIETLDGVTGVRAVVDVLIDVAAEETGPERQEAVRALCSVLTGLDAEIEERPDVRYRDRVRYVTDDEVAATDAEIRALFQEIGEGGTADEATVSTAVAELIRSRPEDLAERLTTLLADREPDDPVVEAALDAVSDEVILAAADPVAEVAADAGESDPAGAREAVAALETLGHDEAREHLSQLMRDASNPLGSAARDALVRSGYYQTVRARETADRARARASESERRADQRERREADRREERVQYKRREAEFRRQLLSAGRTLRDGLIEVLERRIDSLDTLVELQQEDRRVQRLVEEAPSYHQQLGAYLRRLDLGTDVEAGIAEELAWIERNVAYLERLAEADDRRASALDDRLSEVDEELSSLEAIDAPDRDQRTRTELLEAERESLREICEGYRTDAREGEQTAADLRQRLERKRANLEDASVAVSGSFSDIEGAIAFAQQREQRIGALTDRRESEWERVLDAARERESDLEDRLSTLRSTVEELESIQRSIDGTTKAIGDDRLAQQHRSQQSREDQAVLGRIEPRARGAAQQRHDAAVAESEFHRHHEEYLAFIRRYYESRLDAVGSGRFADQYADSIREIEADVEEYYE
ncbi:hypothetical protein [Haloparvum sedimenti]|uniref:hypothetical protein n=1 Tax=Haloparvum sedimenti TaxID=1678448 RepID=UPI00071E6D6A|nr:hypothetical protein [Haloparvum sedimenti]